MIKTIIKYSTKKALLEKFNVAQQINSKINKHIEFKEYHIIYKGNLESGIELNFFEHLSNEELLRVHIILKNMFKDYSCYYINNDIFEGCIKEYLFNSGCGVKGLWKQGFKQDKQMFSNTVKEVKVTKKKPGRKKGSKNKPKVIKKELSLREKMLASVKNKAYWSEKLSV